MKHLLTILILALTCATLHAQTVIVKGTGAGNIRGTGAGSVRGVVTLPYTNYSDGRFTVWNTNQDVVIDNDSGLMWLRDAGAGGYLDWTNAGTYCSDLTNSTYTDWRLPSLAEFSKDATRGAADGLFDAYPSTNSPYALPAGHPFENFGQFYWSSITYTGDTSKAWEVNIEDGSMGYEFKVLGSYTWPCRGP